MCQRFCLNNQIVKIYVIQEAFKENIFKVLNVTWTLNLSRVTARTICSKSLQCAEMCCYAGNLGLNRINYYNICLEEMFASYP